MSTSCLHRCAVCFREGVTCQTKSSQLGTNNCNFELTFYANLALPVYTIQCTIYYRSQSRQLSNAV